MMSALVISAPSQWEKSISSWPDTPGNEVLVAAGEPDDLVREHRADDQRDVVLDDGAVHAHLDAVVQHAADSSATRSALIRPSYERLRVPPFVIEHGHAGIGARRDRRPGTRGARPAPARSILAWVPSATSTVSGDARPCSAPWTADSSSGNGQLRVPSGTITQTLRPSSRTAAS